MNYDEVNSYVKKVEIGKAIREKVFFNFDQLEYYRNIYLWISFNT